MSDNPSVYFWAGIRIDGRQRDEIKGKLPDHVLAILEEGEDFEGINWISRGDDYIGFGIVFHEHKWLNQVASLSITSLIIGEKQAYKDLQRLFDEWGITEKIATWEYTDFF